MTDKVQKIKDWIGKEQDGLMDANGNFGYPEHEGAYHILCSLDAYIDSLQEEPKFKTGNKVIYLNEEYEIADITDHYILHRVRTAIDGRISVLHLNFDKEELMELVKEPVSEDLEDAANNYCVNVKKGFPRVMDETDRYICNAFKAGANWQREKDESTTEDLGEYINELSKQFPEVSFAKLSRIAVRVTKWQKEHLWKPAYGNDLPEIDREIIALLDNGKVVFAHRPPEYWDGKDIATGKVTRHYPKTYDKGGWNIPNVVYWLDVNLPKEIEL